MKHPDGWFRQLMARRVPQIVGLYVAATWMTIEIGEWVSSRLGWPDQVVFYIFILMLALLPSVAVLAWNHGAPGRDEWPRYEKWFLPVNTLVGVIFLLAMVGLGPVGPSSGIGEAQGATVERVVVDESGQEQVFRVAREGFHTRAASFFWTRAGDAPPTWENYAIAWLLAVDLGRDPLLTVSTPWTQGSVGRLQAAGYPEAVGEPVSLSLQIARERGAGMFIRGRYEHDDVGYRLFATVVEVDTGRVVAEHDASGPTLVGAVARLSDRIGPELYGNVTRASDAFVDIDLGDATTSSPEALQRLVEAVNSIAFERNFAVAVDLTQKAIDLDPQFALAYMWLQRFHRAAGDLDAARQAIEGALEYDYKLDSSTLFSLKAILYVVKGEFAKAIRVHEMWAEVHPDSLEALLSLATIKARVGDIDAARNALDMARKADPDNVEIDRETASVMEASGDGEGAVEMLTTYLRAQPDDAAAWVQLGNIEFRAGNYQPSRNALERASILSGSDFEAQLGLARLEAYNGDLEAAIEIAGKLIESRELETERATAAMEQSIFLFMAGRLEDALALLNARESELRRTLSPLAYPQVMGDLKSTMLNGLGRFEAAERMLDEMESELVAPVDAVINIHRIPLYELTGNVSAAETAMERLRFIREEFEFPGREALMNLVQAQMARLQGNPEEAVEFVRQAMETSRRSSLALNVGMVRHLELTLVRYLRAAGRSEDARELAIRMLERHPNLAEARLELAEIEFGADRRDPARRHLDQVLDQWSEADPEYRGYNRAQALDVALAG